VIAQQGGPQNIIIGGMDIRYSGLSETAQNILNAVGGTGYNYNLYGDVDNKFVANIVNNIKAGYSPGQKVQIYGYSKGGDIALQVTRQLNTLGIPVYLLVTIDAADGPLSDTLDRSVPSNVSLNFNFFQTSPSFPFQSHGGYNTGTGLILNYNVSGSTNHGNIDEATMSTAIYLLSH
jgi:hypothetical protein